jgi:hypothetical protein
MDPLFDHFIWQVPLILFWVLYQKAIKSMVPQYEKIFYATCISLTHSLIATSASLYMLIYNCAFGETIATFYSISLSYFLYDTYHSLDDIVFVLHHIVSICALVSSYYMQNNEYYYYTNFLLFIAECTGPYQNVFFLMKSVYGEKNKYEFNRKYIGLFRFYSCLFSVCRLIIAPILIILLLSIIKETIYYYLVMFISISIIVGSILWINGQNKMLKKMIKFTDPQ